MERLARCNTELLDGLKFRATCVTQPATGSRMDFLSSDLASSWGHDPDFVVCDELCHWPRGELWQSLVSSAAKRRQCLLLVLSNAGVGRGWQWEVREAARTNPAWYFSTLTVHPANADVVFFPQAPLLKTIDGGKSLQRIKGPHHGDHHDIRAGAEYRHGLL